MKTLMDHVIILTVMAIALLVMAMHVELYRARDRILCDQKVQYFNQPASACPKPTLFDEFMTWINHRIGLELPS